MGRVENVEVEREETDNLRVVVKGNYIERGEGEDLESGADVSPISHVILNCGNRSQDFRVSFLRGTSSWVFEEIKNHHRFMHVDTKTNFGEPVVNDSTVVKRFFSALLR